MLLMFTIFIACFTIPDTVKEVGDGSILRCGQHILLVDQFSYKSDEEMRFNLEKALYIRQLECPIDPSKTGPYPDAVDKTLEQIELNYLETAECAQPVWAY